MQVVAHSGFQQPNLNLILTSFKMGEKKKKYQILRQFNYDRPKWMGFFLPALVELVECVVWKTCLHPERGEMLTDIKLLASLYET